MKELQLDIMELIAKLEVVLKKGFTQDFLAGNYMSVYKGKGMEFVGFREYDPNDDALLIDWKASLKAGKPMVKQLQEERNITTFFMIDVSESMLFSSHKKLKCEYAAELVATLGYAIHGVGDSVGIALFSDRVIQIIPPGIGRNQFYRILNTLKNAELYGGNFDLTVGINYLLSLKFLRRDSVVFLVSDFIGMKPGWERSLKLAGLKYDLNAIVIRDPVDMRLPNVAGNAHFSDPFSDKQMLVNPSEARQRYETEAKAQITRLQRELTKTRSTMMVLETDKQFMHDIFMFFKFRQKYK